MKSNLPLVSVVIPAYNHAAYVERAIESVLTQTYENIELIVVDDGSKDDTWDVIKRVHEKFNGQFDIVTQDNKGVSCALNVGISKTSGTYVAVLASDDYYAAEKIERQVELFLKSPETVGLVHSSAFADYGKGGDPVSLTGSYLPATGQCFHMLLEQGARVIAPTVMFKRSAYESVQGFDETLIAEDVDFYVSLAVKGWEFAYDPMPLIYKNATHESLGSRMEALHDVHFKILEKHKNRIDPDRYEKLKNNIYKHIIIIAAGNGKLGYAFHTSVTLAKRERNLLPILAFLLHAARNIILRSIPDGVRNNLRVLRSKLLYGNFKK